MIMELKLMTIANKSYELMLTLKRRKEIID
jgi:hypothetical protein